MSSAYLRFLIFLPAILIPARASSSPAFLMTYSANKFNKQGDNRQHSCTPFLIWNQSVVPCPVLTGRKLVGRFYLRYFTLFHMMVNGIVFLISLFVILFSVYRNAIDLCMFISYPASLLNHLRALVVFGSIFRILCVYYHLLSANSDSFTFYFPIWTPFISFSSLISLSMCVCAQAHLTLCDPVDYISLPGSSVHANLQATIMEWVAVSSSRGSSQPRYRTHISCVSCICMRVLYH